MTGAELDPVRARRAQVARLAALARATGLACYGLATVLVVVGVFTRFSSAIATAAIAGLVVGSVLLAPGLVAGYGVKAAERDDP